LSLAISVGQYWVFVDGEVTKAVGGLALNAAITAWTGLGCGSGKLPLTDVVTLVVFAGPVHWTKNMTETKLNTTAKDQTAGCSCTNSEKFWLPVARFVEKWKDPKRLV